MSVRVCHRWTTLISIMIPPNPEPRQRLLSLSICASQNTGLGYTEEEQMLEVMRVRHFPGRVLGPGAQEVATKSDPGLIQAHKVLLLGFFWKDSKPEVNQMTHTHTHTQVTQYLHLKFLLREMAWEKLAYRVPVGLGISHYYSVYCSPVGLSV